MQNYDRVESPFSPAQVESLTAYQESGAFHPFTCGGCSNRDGLIATAGGWMCPTCDYTQHWAHGWMANWDWAGPAAKYVRKLLAERRGSFGTAWVEIERLIALDAKHRSGVRLSQMSASAILDRAESEIAELRDECAAVRSVDTRIVVPSAAQAVEELGDVFGCLLHLAIKLGTTPTELSAIMLAKFAERFDCSPPSGDN